MLGTTRLHTIFGAARRGYNTAGVGPLRSLLNSYANEGLAVMFIAPEGKRPADYRTATYINRHKKEWEEAGNTGEPPSGFYLATDQKQTLASYLKEARKRNDGPNTPVDARYGLTPLNFALVPDRSRVVVIDCDTTLEVDAFRNWYMDRTGDLTLRKNLDVTPPSVTSPGDIKGGHWDIVQDGYVYDDYGHEVYVPPVYGNHGGNAAHSGGGHWYFFYPEGYDLPEGAPATIPVHYDAESRTPLLQEIRDAEDNLAYIQEDTADSDAIAAAQQRIDDAYRALNERREWALKTYEDKGFVPKPDHLQTPEDPLASSFTAMIKNCYVIIPPSNRREGYYEVVSGDFEWEPWLEELIGGVASKSAVQSHPSVVTPAPTNYGNNPGMVDGYAAITSYPASSLNEIIEPWAQLTSWEAILTPEDGWIRQVNDRCGCPIFTAPGKHSSPKSVTAHDGGCTLPGGCSELGRLHFWTTNPPAEFVSYMIEGKRDFSKMSALAITQFEGNQRKAIESAGLTIPALRDVGNIDDRDFNDFLLEQLDAAIAPTEESAQEPLTLEPFDVVINEPPPVYIVSNTFESNSFNAMIGPSGSGKSFVAIDLAAALVTGGSWMGQRCRQMKVAYFAGEGRRGVVDRFRAWQTVRGDDSLLMGHKMFFANYLPNLSMYTNQDFEKLADMIISTESEFVIIDTWSRANAGADENAAETTSKTIDTLNGMQRRVMEKLGNCTILVIHHTRKDSDSARGSSAFNAALDTELLIKAAEDMEDAGRRLIQVEVSKQKNSEPWSDPLYCQIKKVGEDKVELDADGFPNTVKAPASIADLDGNFPGPAPAVGADGVITVNGQALPMFGSGNYTLSEPVRSSAGVDVKEIYKEIEYFVSRVGQSTRGEIKKNILDQLRSKTPNFYLPPHAEMEVLAALDSCVTHGMLQLDGSRYKISRLSRKRDAEEVFKIATGKDDG